MAPKSKTVELDDEDSPFDLDAEQDHIDAVTRREAYEPNLGDGELPDAKSTDDDPDGDQDRARREDDPDDDGETYGRRAQKRIDKLTARRKAAEAAKEAAERQLQQEREQAARIRKERDELEARYRQTSEQYVTTATQQLENTIASKRAALKDAIEDGDTEKQIELTEELGELRFRYSIAKQQAAARQKQGDEREQGQQRQRPADEGQTTAQQQQAAPETTPLQQQWLARNKAWFTDPAYEEARDYAYLVDARLTHKRIAEAGIDPAQYWADASHFEELDRLVRERFPEIADEIGEDDGDDDDDAPPRRRETRQTVTGVPSGASRPATGSKKRVRLSAQDLQTMRNFSLDPENAEHRAMFAAERL